jgi:hypothetical protein
MTRKAYETFDVCCVKNDKKPAYRAEIDNKRNIATEVTGAARSLGTRRHVSPWSAKTTKIAE